MLCCDCVVAHSASRLASDHCCVVVDIDFGHFLGNFKQKFGINRERAAFVFTPEMAYVMGGSKYRSSALFKKFLQHCSKALKTLRDNANLLENLFGLMVAAGMPELMKESDIHYMRDKLYLQEKDSKADKKLSEEIENSLDSKYRRFDNFIHVRHNTHVQRTATQECVDEREQTACAGPHLEYSPLSFALVLLGFLSTQNMRHG